MKILKNLIPIFVILVLSTSTLNVFALSSVSAYENYYAAASSRRHYYDDDYYDDYDGIFEKIEGIFRGVVDLPKKIVNRFIDSFAREIKDYYEMRLQENIMEIEGMLSGFKNILTKDNINSSIFSFAKSLAYALKPTAYSLIALFFIMDFTKKTIYFEVMNHLNIIKPLLKLIITKYFVDNSIYVLSLILDITRDITYKVFSYINVHNMSTVMNFGAINDTSSLQSIGNTIFDMALWFVGRHIFSIFCIILIIVCYVMAYMRLIEIAYMCAVSPLFFSTLAGDLTNDVFRGFVKNFVAVAFQSVWMAVGLGFFATGYINGITGGASLSAIPNMIIGLLTLTIYIVKAPSSVKSALGGTGGGGINLGSVVQLAAMAL